MSDKQYDVVVFGATSFVGKILCRYLLETYGVNQDLKWALAGRSEGKLEKVIKSLGPRAGGLPWVKANADSEEQMLELCGKTKVVISTVGPYALYGEPLVKSCAETGTHYVDLTGEVQWVRRMIDRYENKAKESGAYIIHSCGFDSIPSDMGVYYLQEQAKAKFGKPCKRVTMGIKKAKGGVSGGTIASLLNVSKEVSVNKNLGKELRNPYYLCPRDFKPMVQQHEINLPVYFPEHESWAGKFVMEAINTRVVFRSNALLDLAYGSDFQYEESVLTGKGIFGAIKASFVSAGTLGAILSSSFTPTRNLVEKFLVPKPGQGPSEKLQQEGFYDIRFHGSTDAGEVIEVRSTADTDPGYRCTAKMLAESGISLAKDFDGSKKPGGFWTTASMFGDKLIKRLEDHAGMTFEVIS